MNLVETLRGLLRRWYITFPGLVLAIAAAVGAWMVVPVQYERTATQFLLPGAASMPENSNPFLYLGGLSYATDVVVRALGSENVLNEVTEDNPGVAVTVARDGSTSGPVVVTTVTATDDELAGAVLESLVGKTEGVLSELQDGEDIPADNRISAVTLTVDERGEVQQRNRLVATVGIGLAIAAVTLLTAGLVDGVTRQRRRRAEGDDEDESPVETADDDTDLTTRETAVVDGMPPQQTASAADPEDWPDDDDPVDRRQSQRKTARRSRGVGTPTQG